MAATAVETTLADSLRRVAADGITLFACGPVDARRRNPRRLDRVLATDPREPLGVGEQYYAAATAPADADHISVANWATPVIGSWIRVSLPGQPFWVQFVPPVLAVVGFGVWYFAKAPTARCRRPRGHDAVGRCGFASRRAPTGVAVRPRVIASTDSHNRRGGSCKHRPPPAIVDGIGWFVAVNG